MPQATHSYADVELTVSSDSLPVDSAMLPAITGLDQGGIPLIGTAEVDHYDSEVTSVDFVNEKLTFVADKNKYLDCSTIYYLGEVATERTRQLNNGALFHGAAVSFPDINKSALIMGEKGSGKTTTAVYLCKINAAELIANDQVIIGSNPNAIHLVTGSKNLRIRRSAALQEGLIGSLVQFVDLDTANWDYKKDIEPASIGIAKSKNPIELTNIFQVFIDRTLSEVVVIRNNSDLQTILFLGEIMSRHISGLVTPLLTADLNLEGFAPNLDSPETVANRTKLINRMLKEIGVTKVNAPSGRYAVDAMMSCIDD